MRSKRPLGASVPRRRPIRCRQPGRGPHRISPTWKDRERTLSAGSRSHAAKPVDPEELTAVLTGRTGAGHEHR
jgi:hypothetical protein